MVTSLTGSESIVVDGRQYDIAAGDTYLIQPGRLHDLGSRRGNTPCWVHFDLIFDPLRRQHPPAGAYDRDLRGRTRWLQPDAQQVFGSDLPVHCGNSIRPFARALMPRLVARYQEQTALAILEATCDLTRLLATLVSQVQASEQGNRVDPLRRIEHAETVARSQLDTGMDATGMAKAGGLSRARFARLYRRVRGRTPGSFLDQERMQRAESLLRRSDLSIAEVGTLVGMPDATVFGRWFRRTAGTTPSVWRKHATTS